MKFKINKVGSKTKVENLFTNRVCAHALLFLYFCCRPDVIQGNKMAHRPTATKLLG